MKSTFSDILLNISSCPQDGQTESSIPLRGSSPGLCVTRLMDDPSRCSHVMSSGREAGHRKADFVQESAKSFIFGDFLELSSSNWKTVGKSRVRMSLFLMEFFKSRFHSGGREPRSEARHRTSAWKQ